MLPWAVDTPFWDHTANHSGGTPCIYTVDGAAEVVDAIVWDTIHPLGEYAVGWKAMGTVLGARVWPVLAERVAADLVHASQVTVAPPAPPTTGLLCPTDYWTNAAGRRTPMPGTAGAACCFLASHTGRAGMVCPTS